jgi:hypothetical protein
MIVGADVVPADVVAPDDEDVGLLLLCLRWKNAEYQRRGNGENDGRESVKVIWRHVFFTFG